MNTKLSRYLVLTCLALLNLEISPVFAQGDSFTYDGRLIDKGEAANGSYDLTFTLYNASTGGATVGVSNVLSDLTISNGLFTVTLNYGASAFDGTPRWLEVAVRPGQSTGGYSLVLPRQRIGAAPYAITAGNVTGPINGGLITPGSITGTQLAAGAVTGANIASNTITSTQLAQGAAAQNLNSPGQSGVPSGGLVLSAPDNHFASGPYCSMRMAC